VQIGPGIELSNGVRPPVLGLVVFGARIAENAALFDFELSAAEMARLDALDVGLHVAWDPTGVS